MENTNNSQAHDDCRWWHMEFDKIVLLGIFVVIMAAWVVLYVSGNIQAADKLDAHMGTTITAIIALTGARALRRPNA